MHTKRCFKTFILQNNIVTRGCQTPKHDKQHNKSHHKNSPYNFIASFWKQFGSNQRCLVFDMMTHSSLHKPKHTSPNDQLQYILCICYQTPSEACNIVYRLLNIVFCFLFGAPKWLCSTKIWPFCCDYIRIWDFSQNTTIALIFFFARGE